MLISKIVPLEDCFECDPVQLPDKTNSSMKCPVSESTKTFLSLADKFHGCIVQETNASCNRCRVDYKTLEGDFASLKNPCFDVENAVIHR